MGDEADLENSILQSIKKTLGLTPEIIQFDLDIIIAINSAFNVLFQLGVGPTNGFEIHSKEEIWSDFLDDDPRLNMAKSYVSIKTKLIFDPPTVAAVLNAYQEMLKEYEYRLSYQADPTSTFE